MKNSWRNNFWNEDAVVHSVLLQHLKEGERGIKKVYFVNDLGNTPAKCLRSTGECWISLKHWNKLPFEYKAFILLHENEHILQDTSNELKVDAAAHKKYLRMGYSITQSILALTKVLSYTSPEHLQRTKEQMIRATVYDITVNKNEKLKDWLINGNKNLKPQFKK